MDPNATLEDIRAIAGSILLIDEYDSLSIELAEKIEALDKWITGGGFLPNDWKEV